MEKLQEAFLSNWYYTLPEDPETMLYDFYFLSILIGQDFSNSVSMRDEVFNYALEEGLATCIGSVHTHMKRALKWSLACEFRHILNRSSGLADFTKDNDEGWNFIEEYRQNYKLADRVSNGYLPDGPYKRPLAKLDKVPLRGPLATSQPSQGTSDGYLISFRSVVVTQNKMFPNQSKEYKDLKFGNIARDAFNKLRWQAGYGGPAWEGIANGYLQLLRASTIKEKSIWVDHAYDLQHNNDVVFDKVNSYYKNKSLQWLKNALNWKRDQTNMLDYYDLVSYGLKPVVAYVVKHLYGDTLENKKRKVKDGERVKAEIWDNTGEWILGIWEGGTWKNGTWENGTWWDGTWEKGTWKNGTWENGTWKSGIWEKGIWKKGKWLDGEWRTGIWIDGLWLKGIWKNGGWKDGVWKDGIWETGNWRRGEWQNGVWNDGIWERGLWRRGTWNTGIWNQGTILSDKFGFLVASFHNPTLFKKYENESQTPEELIKKVSYA